MKKQKKRLSLHRETVLLLNGLGNIRGGTGTTQFPESDCLGCGCFTATADPTCTMAAGCASAHCFEETNCAAICT